jgi:uncharacterized protein YcnI
MTKVVLPLLLLMALSFPSFAAAHVVVKPDKANVGAFQTFSIGVPVEKDIPTIGIRLQIPEGLKHVTPNVKPGWQVTVNKQGEGEAAVVTEIVWTGGLIPAGQRDEFAFSAQVPTKEGPILWKAYQIYQGNTVVAWDQAPNKEQKDFSVNGPYSQTQVINDLVPTAAKGVDASVGQGRSDLLSMVAIGISLLALGLQLFRPRSS